jgi:hypothetical protein
MQLFAAAVAAVVLVTSNPTIVAQTGGRLEPVEEQIGERLTPDQVLMVYQRCSAFFSAQSLRILTFGRTEHEEQNAEKATRFARAFRDNAASTAVKYNLGVDDAAMDATLQKMTVAYLGEFVLSGDASGTPVMGIVKTDYDFCIGLGR